MTSRIPHLLQPYLSLPPEASLVLLTGVLGASTNWLVLRHLHALLKPPSHSQHHSQQQTLGNENDEEQEGEVAVLLVSFLRDLAFWKEGLSRLGVDVESAGRKGKFGYVDGLGAGLFSGDAGVSTVPVPAGAGAAGAGAAGAGVGLGQRVVGGAAPGLSPRGVPTPASPTAAARATPALAQGQRAVGGAGVPERGGAGWKRSLTSITPGDIARVILQGVEQLQATGSSGNAKKVVLVVDGLDFVLAASPPSSRQQGQGEGTAMGLRDMLIDLREKTHAAIVTLAADDPLVREQETALEKQHAWFTLGLAHEADTVLSLRLLDTGAAKDVTGVIRITRGGSRSQGKDHEYLYHVGGDGGVRVFERGQ